MKRGIFYIIVLIAAVLSCAKNEPVEDMSGFRQENESVSVIPDGESKVISFTIDESYLGMDTKSGINLQAEMLKPEKFITSDEDKAKAGTFVSVALDKTLLPNYDNSPAVADTKASTYLTFESQVTDLNSFHVYAYTPGSTQPSNRLRYAWDEEFIKGADGVFRSASSREWPDTDPTWSFIATNCPAMHLYRMNTSGDLMASGSMAYKYNVGTSPSYNSVMDAMFAFNYNNSQTEWSAKTNILNNGSTGYTTSTYKARNTLSFKHMYARIGNVTVVNQTGQSVSNVHIELAGTLASNCFGFGVSAYYNITNGSWSARDNNSNWITSFGPTSAGTVDEGMYFIAPSSVLFHVSWEADEPSGHKTYTNIPVTVTGFQPGINYNLTFTLGMGGQPVPQVNYFRLYIVSSGPGANDCLVFGSQTTMLNIGYYPTIYYSLDGGNIWSPLAMSRMTSNGKAYYHTLPVHQGDYILLRGNLENNPTSDTRFGDRYFMFADYNALSPGSNDITPVLQPSSIAAAYAMGDMRSLAEGRVLEAGGVSYKAGDFTDLFNAFLPLSVGQYLYSHPSAYDYYNDPDYNIFAPWYTDIESGDRVELNHDVWNMTRCFQGTHLSYLPYNGDSPRDHILDPYTYTRCIWTNCYASCTELVDDAVLDIHFGYYSSNLVGFRNFANHDRDFTTIASASPLDDFFNDTSGW